MRWRTHLVTNLQHNYEHWRQVQFADEHMHAAMASQIARATGDRQVALRASERDVAEAFSLVAAELDTEMKRRLAEILEITPDTVTSLVLSIDRCAESPWLGCVYPREPEFGDQCVFCHLYYR